MDTYTKNRVNPCNPCLKKVDAYFDTSTFFLKQIKLKVYCTGGKYKGYYYFNSCNMRFKTTVAEISRLAASGMTSEVGASMTSSVTIMLRRTGRQCMK